MKRNFVLTAISIGSRLSTSLVLFIIFARFWGPVEYGVFSFVFSVSALLVLIVEFGLQSFLLREIAAIPSACIDLIRSTIWVKLVFLPFFILTSIIVFSLLKQGAPVSMAVPLCLAVVLLSFADFFIAPLRAMGRYDLETYTIIGTNLFQLVVASYAIFAGASTVEIAWILVFTRLIQLIISYAVLLKQIPDLSLSFPGIAKVTTAIRQSFPYGIDGFITTAWLQIDVVVVRLIFGPQIVGLYAAGQRTVQAASAIAPVIGNVMVPKLAQASNNTAFRWSRDGKMAILMMGIAGLVFSLPLILFPNFIAVSLFGKAYQELAHILPFFGILVFIRFLASGIGILLTGAGLQSQRVGIQLLSLVIFFVGAFITYQFSLSINFLISVIIFSFTFIGLGYWWKLMRAKFAPV